MIPKLYFFILIAFALIYLKRISRILSLRHPILFIFIFFAKISYAQKTPILSFSIDQNKRARIEVKSDSNKYYILKVDHKKLNVKSYFSAMVIGKTGLSTLTETTKAYPKEHYEVLEFDIKQAKDSDKDGVNDIIEFKNPINQSPFNAAKKIEFKDGVVQIIDKTLFKKLSYKGSEIVKIDPHLANLEFLKFYIIGEGTDNAQIYFMNCETHKLHETFKKATQINTIKGSGILESEMKGEIVFHPDVISSNGTKGAYRFAFQPYDKFTFTKVQLAFDLISSNMPFLNNNLSYYPMPNAALELYNKEKPFYEASRIPILLEKDIFAEIDYLALNQTESYGLLTELERNTRPSPRDIVICKLLPNEMPRTGGIISITPQTPLSHVNLRASQDNVPNAYIKNGLDNPKIKNLIGKYVHYVVKQSEFILEEATKEQVNAWFDLQRPKQIQTPVNDVSFKKILRLDDIDFGMAKAFGSKCANVASMRKFGFEKSTIPDGFGIPFHFYREFMLVNGLFDKISTIITDSVFIDNAAVRVEILQELRNEIIKGEMPAWMMSELSDMQKKFGKSAAIRCRSSTNNEDLPNFSGAGLYDSKTHKISEGHISKTIKEVFASLWNFRAFEERDFFKVDHLNTSMGILCHPNYINEKVNGVAVSTDPLYHTNNSFYLNNQIGEDLITNPNSSSEPEEILMDNKRKTTDFYSVIRYSNASNSKKIIEDKHLITLRNYISTIHVRFQKLYDMTESKNFSMEIEYKITKNNTLIIKQARPWIGANTSEENNVTEDEIFNPKNIVIEARFSPNPFSEDLELKLTLEMEGLVTLLGYNLNGGILFRKDMGYYPKGTHTIKLNSVENMGKGQLSIVKVSVSDGIKEFETTNKIIKK